MTIPQTVEIPDWLSKWAQNRIMQWAMMGGTIFPPGDEGPINDRPVQPPQASAEEYEE